jgi:hypothetical protein
MVLVRPSFRVSLILGPDLGGFTPGSRLSNMTPLERKIRNSSGRHSLAIGGRVNRDTRSPSVPGEKDPDPAQLVSDEDAHDYNRTFPNLDGD